VSAARPRIADYPFTTLTPSLGMVRLDPDTEFVIADLPGIIPGASEGAGLGIRFLKHLSRTAFLVFFVDLSDASGRDPVADFHALRKELAAFGAGLGAKPAIGYSMMAYVDSGDEVIYPSPGFPIYESWVTYLGGIPKPLILREDRGFAFRAADLESLLTERTKVLMLCSPSNPTGGVLPRELLEEVAELAKRRAHPDFRVYSDEIYEHITFDGFKHVSMASLPGMRERTVIASGHSKGFAMTGWRLGWMVLPTEEEALRFKQININTVSCTPPFVQEAAREALESSLTPGVVRGMVEEFRHRRDFVVPALNAIPGIRCANPLGAFYAFPNISGVCESLGASAWFHSQPESVQRQTSPATLVSRFLLYFHGVALVDRRSFGVIGSEGQDFLRVYYATDMDSLKKGIARIAAGAADSAGFERFLKDETALGVAA